MPLISPARARAMYAGGRGGAAARRWTRFWAVVQGWGVLPRRWVTLEVAGASSGLARRFPLGMAEVGGRWYLVSMLGECAWVRNVRAAHGRAVLVRRGRHQVRLVEVPADERAPMLARYVQVAPGGRPHIPVQPGEPLSHFAAVAARYPVFLVVPDVPTRLPTPRRSRRPA